MSINPIKPREEATGTRQHPVGVFSVIVRFTDYPSNAISMLLDGRGFRRQAQGAWYGEGVPRELTALLRDCGGTVEVR